MLAYSHPVRQWGGLRGEGCRGGGADYLSMGMETKRDIENTRERKALRQDGPSGWDIFTR